MPGDRSSRIADTPRKFFHWQFSNWFIALFLGLGGSLAGLATTSDAIADTAFAMAYLCLAAALILSVGTWLTSDTLRRRDPNTWSKKERERGGVAAQRRFYLRKFGGSILISVLLSAPIWATRRVQIAAELSRLEGWLHPGNEPLPQTACGEPGRDLLFVFLGGVVGGSDRFPHTVLRVRGKDRLILDRRPDGSVAVSLDVLSADGRIVARLDKGKFVVNQNNYLTMNRRDRSSVSVKDQFGTEVLSVRYFNKRAIWINAVLRYPGVKPIVFSGGKQNVAGLCVFRTGRADINIE